MTDAVRVAVVSAFLTDIDERSSMIREGTDGPEVGRSRIGPQSESEKISDTTPREVRRIE